MKLVVSFITFAVLGICALVGINKAKQQEQPNNFHESISAVISNSHMTASMTTITVVRDSIVSVARFSEDMPKELPAKEYDIEIEGRNKKVSIYKWYDSSMGSVEVHYIY